MALWCCVIGPFKSGKTFISKLLEGQGFLRLSAADAVAELFNVAHAKLSRRQLAEMGYHLYQSGRQAEIADVMLRRAKDHTHVVVDGIRFPQTLDRLASHERDLRVICVTTSNSERRSRHAASMPDMSFEQLTEHVTERFVAAMCADANFRIDGGWPRERIERALAVAARPLP